MTSFALLRTLPLLLVLAAVAGAATVRRAEETTLTGRLVAVRDGKLRLATDAAAPVEVPLDDIVEVVLADAPATGPAVRQVTTLPITKRNDPVTQAASTTSRPTTVDTRPWQVQLSTGDTLTLTPSGWSGGRVSGTVSGVPLDVPVAAVRDLWCGAANQVAEAKALGEAGGADDIAFAVRDGKIIAVRGVAEGVEDKALRFKFGDQTRSIALARLVGVVFARPVTAADAPAAAPQQAFVLASGNALPGTWTSIDDKSVGLTTTWGQALTLPRRDVTRIAFRNGRVLSLSDLTPARVEQTPYFDRLLGWKIDRALDDKPLQLTDGPVARGLAVHARTQLTYALNGQFVQFRSRVGFQQPAGRSGDAVVRVTADGRTLFEKPRAKGTDAPFDVTVDVSGVQSLTLDVDFGQDQDVGDRVVWANARLLRPQTPSEPARP
ncbi:MAG TPA: NPCBM/NEW2 domain-containing protein [Tepidisphaeraceae bacterium]|jgi:hypothetical protein